MASAPKITNAPAAKRGRSFSESRNTPPRAVFNELSDAHASITGRRPSNWPTLSPGWAKDQPVSPRNPKSTPLECVARVSPPSVGTPAEAAYGHVVASRERHHVELISPTVNRPLRNRPMAPVGPPEIPESEIGEIGSKFPGLSREGSSVDAMTFYRWHASQPNSQFGNSHRRSRSLGRLPGVPGPISHDTADQATAYGTAAPYSSISEDHHSGQVQHNGEANASLPQNNTMSDIYQSYALENGMESPNRAESPANVVDGDATYSHGVISDSEHASTISDEYMWSRRGSVVANAQQFSAEIPLDVEPEEFPMRNRGPRVTSDDDDRVSSIQASIARTRGPELPQNDSYESFQAWIEGAPAETDSEEDAPGAANSVARVALIHSSGLVQSRPMSEAEMMGLEQHIIRHLRSPSNVSLLSDQTNAVMDIHGDIFHPQGRLSIEFNPEVVNEGQVRPGSSRSSSSISYATYHLRRYGHPIGQGPEAEGSHYHQEELGVPRTRSGTPPLLFGSNAIGQVPCGRRAPSAENEAESEHDWETVEGLSRQGTRGNRLQGTVSSHADYSSSSSEMKTRGLPAGGQSFHHSLHPRYVRSWNMLRDEHTGRTILLSEDGAGASQLPNQNTATPQSMRRPLFNNYHHPSPLSQRQAQLFDSSPLSMEPEHGSPGTEGAVSLARPRAALNLRSMSYRAEVSYENASDQVSISGDDSDVLEMASKSEQARKYGYQKSSKKDQSSAWLSTDDDGNTDVFVDQRAREGSFAQMAATGPKANVTGTPQGTGAREVGSSLANASSPNEGFKSSPYLGSSPVVKTAEVLESGKILHRRTIDGSLDTIRTASSDALFKSLHKVSGSEHSVYSQDQDLTALPAVLSNLPREVLEHRQHLIDNKLLPRPKTPPFTEPKRHSVPLSLLTPIKKATTSTGAALGRQFQQILPNLPALPHIRHRSPQRRAPAENQASPEFELPVFHPSAPKMKKARRNKDARKRKVSDSDESNNSPNHTATSPSAHLLTMAPTGPRASVTTSIEPVELEGIAVHPTTTANTGDRGRNQTASNRVPHVTVGTASNDRGRNATSSNQVDTAPVAVSHEARGTRSNLSHLQDKVGEEWKPLYMDLPGRGASDVLSSFSRPMPRPVPPPGYTRENYPDARPESPHLYRVPRRPSPEQRLKYQKDVSRIVLLLCIFCPPMWLAYGCGSMDKVMDWCSGGDIQEMRKEEKMIALVLAGIVALAVFVATPIGLVFYALGAH